jgi:hypothetical protein
MKQAFGSTLLAQGVTHDKYGDAIEPGRIYDLDKDGRASMCGGKRKKK